MENRKESDSFDTECTITTLPNIAPNMVMGQLTQSARESSSAILAGNETSARIQTSTTMAADLRWQQMQEQFLQNQQTMQTMMLQMNEMQKQISASTPCGNDSAGKKRKIDESSTSGKEKGKQTAEKVTPIHDISDISDEETDRDGFKDLLNGRESDAEDPEDSDSEETRDTADLLQELEECFGAEEKCGEAVHAKLAEVANNGVRCKLNQDKIKEAGDKYLRPKNVENLVTPKVNNEVWGHLSRKVKNQDLRLQKTQALICKAIMPQLQLLDILLKANENKGQKIAPKDILKLALDSLKLMEFVYCDMSYRRRELIIQPDGNHEFRALCSNEHPVTDNLFGNDLGKVVEDLLKGNKVGSKISGTTRRSFGRSSFGRGQFQRSGRSDYNRQPFLGQGSRGRYPPKYGRGKPKFNPKK